MKFVRVGIILGAFRLEGVLRVKNISDNPGIFDNMEFLLLAKDGEPVKSLRITDIHEHNDTLLVTVAGVTDGDKAEALKGLDVIIPEDRLPREDKGEVYWYKIDGATVVDKDGGVVGVLCDYVETGSCDAFRIKLSDGGYALISNNEDHVLKIDVEKREVIIDLVGLVSEDV